MIGLVDGAIALVELCAPTSGSNVVIFAGDGWALSSRKLHPTYTDISVSVPQPTQVDNVL
jgi:hypothetical protein